jgi:5-histidylcysteine sulfoxide synthase/putative 4-mercaptohistidine N1-methyltranferase
MSSARTLNTQSDPESKHAITETRISTTMTSGSPSLPLLNLNAGRGAVLAYFKNTWALTELLFSSLNSDEVYFLAPYHKTRHPLVFYYAHPACFYANKLLVSGLTTEPINQNYELLFEAGVDEMGWDDLHEGEQNIWPDLADVRKYRQKIYDLVVDVITKHPAFDETITMDSPAWALAMGFEHERIHMETSSVLIRELPIEHVSRPAAWPDFQKLEKSSSPAPSQLDNPLIALTGAEVKLGKPADWPSFGWDNEYGQDIRETNALQASKFLISNAEFYRFVKDGGYENEQYWTKASWGWRKFRNAKWPTFWIQDGPSGSHRYRLRTIFSIEPMQWDWPAVVNYYEAKAYCAWRNEQEPSQTFKLPNEAEYLRIRGIDTPNQSTWKATDKDAVASDPVMNVAASEPFNLNLQFGSESPVGANEANSLGFHDVMGNVWQWSEDTFHPLQEFKIHPYYTDFSTPCYDDEHHMILGGSFISTGDEASMWSRFHFRPHFFQHAGFRLVVSENAESGGGKKYETTELVDQYLLFHWGSDEEQRDDVITDRIGHPGHMNLMERTVELVNEYSTGNKRALDLGCAVGRTTFDLGRTFGKVTGLDFSQAFIDAANHLKSNAQLAYKRIETGSFTTPMMAKVDDDIDRKNIDFVVGDAMKLKDISALAENGPYDAILLSNLMCRLTHPIECLEYFTKDDQYIKKGGVLVFASPNTWMDQYTDPALFLDGESNEQTLQKLGELLPGFTRLHEEDLPFMIREHRRKYEYIVSQVSVWRKN